jgi:hypothetical protein
MHSNLYNTIDNQLQLLLGEHVITKQQKLQVIAIDMSTIGDHALPQYFYLLITRIVLYVGILYSGCI